MAATMKALVKRHAEKGIWMEQVPVPVPGSNEVLIKLEKTAICGTDLHIYKWDEWSQRVIKPGLVIGHEFVGRIVEMGQGVTGYKIGDRADEFMASHHRHRHRLLRPLVPIVDVDVGTADRGFPDLDQHVVRADLRYRNLFHPYARLGLCLDQRLHHVRHAFVP